MDTTAPRTVFLANMVVHQHSSTVNGVGLLLTRFETLVLHRLAQNPGQCVTHAELHSTLYGDAEGATSPVIQVIVYRLRKKLSAAGAHCEIVTKRSLGYTLQVHPS